MSCWQANEDCVAVAKLPLHLFEFLKVRTVAQRVRRFLHLNYEKVGIIMHRLMHDDIREHQCGRQLAFGIWHFDVFWFDTMTVVLGMHGVVWERPLQNSSKLAANHSFTNVNLDSLQFFCVERLKSCE